MAEFTGERVIPDAVDPDLLNEHVARYAFAARLARGKRVLDAGCGTGYGSVELAKSALSVVGLDISGEAAGYAREHYRLPNLSFAVGSCAALPHGNASFDLVVGFEVIEHLEHWQEFLMEVRRVLAPSGQFIVSTPNKLYYAESRARTGPNPFHVHEFEYAEFRDELAAVFPSISIFVENHVGGVIFRPVGEAETSEVRVDGTDVQPADGHFFVAICAAKPPAANAGFVYVPRAGNVLRERERHIDLLRDELQRKDTWLEKAKTDLKTLNEEHQKLLGMFRDLQVQLQHRNEWALRLNRELEAARDRIQELQQEADTTVAAYEAKVAELERENLAKTEWALETETRLGGELENKKRELARLLELLHNAEHTIEERTKWALELQGELEALRTQVGMCKASRWIKLGRRIGLGPDLPTA